MALYKHRLFEPASGLIKYRGKSNQIDVTDTVITILDKFPGSTWFQIVNMIFSPDLYKSRSSSVSRVLKDLVEKGLIIKNDKFYYLWDDAWSHDIGKTKNIIERLNKIGVSDKMANFLSSGIIMAAEEAQGTRSLSIATGIGIKPELIDIKVSEVEIEPEHKRKSKDINIQNNNLTDHVLNPFDILSSKEINDIKEQVQVELFEQKNEIPIDTKVIATPEPNFLIKIWRKIFNL